MISTCPEVVDIRTAPDHKTRCREVPAVTLFDIRGFHAAELRFSVVVRGFGDPGLAAHILNGASGFDGLQNGDDLVFGE